MQIIGIGTNKMQSLCCSHTYKWKRDTLARDCESVETRKASEVRRGAACACVCVYVCMVSVCIYACPWSYLCLCRHDVYVCVSAHM